jgi:hypothetical protein
MRHAIFRNKNCLRKRRRTTGLYPIASLSGSIPGNGTYGSAHQQIGLQHRPSLVAWGFRASNRDREIPVVVATILRVADDTLGAAAKHYGVRGDLTTGGPPNCPMAEIHFLPTTS